MLASGSSQKLGETSFVTTFQSPILFCLDERDVERILEPLGEDVMSERDYKDLRDELGGWVSPDDFSVDFILNNAHDYLKMDDEDAKRA